MKRSYVVIDLKSFYASCECAQRGLHPLKTNLVVADPERGKGTLCLAVSPSLKAQGVKNRCRVYEIPKHIPYLMAPPRMQLYINYAAEIYDIYLDYLSKDDIFVYSIDEAFLDITSYIPLYGKSPKELAQFLLHQIWNRLYLPATCSIGTNLYLAKIALDIVAKHSPDYIGELSELTFKETLWHHRPLTDFWRIGKGTERRLHSLGIYDMAGVASSSYDKLKKVFGVDAAILYDHAWGREPTTITDIKNYRPKARSVSVNQVLLRDYSGDEALLIVVEMAEQLALELTRRRSVAQTFTLFIGFSMRVRTVPPVHASFRLYKATDSQKLITDHLVTLYKEKVPSTSIVRRIGLSAEHILPNSLQQMSLFESPADTTREHKKQLVLLEIKKRFGKNSIFRGIDLLDGATTRQRNEQIGGHKDGGKETRVTPRQNISTL